MKYGSVCSGIEAATVAWHPLGWEPQWFSEIENFPSAVLAHRFPDVPNLGDMTKIHETDIFNATDIDVLVGGTPCQSFSVAGLRKGLADPRGNLMLTYLALADRKRPTWLVWENVPGVLSSNGGKDFGTFLGGLAELGYGFSYRILDAQYFGVAQRRRRVFVVGYLGDWRPAAAVLFERHSLSGHPAPRREKREGAAGAVESSAGSSGSWWDGSQTAATLTKQNANGDQRMPDKANFGAVIQAAHTFQVRGGWPAEIASTLNAQYGDKMGLEDQHALNGSPLFVPHAFKVRGCEGGGKGYLGQDEAAFTISTGQDQMVFDPNQITSKTNRSTPKPEICHTLPATSNSPIAFSVGESPDVAHRLRSGASKADKHESTTYVAQPIPIDTMGLGRYGDKDDLRRGLGIGSDTDPSFTLTKAHSHAAFTGTAIRRLTPVECERLQGFPDNHTRIPYRNKPAEDCPDGPRYKACGNSMAVPVMRWIGERIDAVSKIIADVQPA